MYTDKTTKKDKTSVKKTKTDKTSSNGTYLDTSKMNVFLNEEKPVTVTIYPLLILPWKQEQLISSVLTFLM